MQERSGFKVYLALLALSLVLGVATVLTLIPAAGASWPNILGYKSLCTFAPIATVIMALVTECVCVIRGRLFGPRRGVKRTWAVPVIVALALAGTLIFSVPAYVKAKTDASTSASVASADASKLHE